AGKCSANDGHRQGLMRQPRPKQPFRGLRVRRALRGLALLAGAALGGVLLLACWPMRTAPLRYIPLPPMSFQRAVSRLDEQEKEALPTLQSGCRSQVLHHGRRTERVFVLLHGLSN